MKVHTAGVSTSSTTGIEGLNHQMIVTLTLSLSIWTI